jgi:DNA topoisomerase VI subunit B
MTTRVPTLIRTHHTIGRAAEYFTARELEAQTGQWRTKFAAVVLKELVDNALDAAESTGVAPAIEISIDRRGGDLEIAVRDNGPGLPAGLVTKTLDFDVRTSDKRAYRSPTRGAQGNALKTIIGIPTALGGSAPIVIEACNVRHTIRPRLDAAGNVDPGHTVEEIPVTTGTRIAVTLPAIDQDLDAVAWARAFALVNPHTSVKITDSDESRNHAYCETFDAPDSYRTWHKWGPTDPTSPHWYDGSSFQTLIDTEVASARHAGRESRLVRDFVRDFRGLSATAKAKTVCATVPNATHLADLNGEAGTLLAAMRAEAKPAKPDVLGSVGEEHIRDCVAAWYGIVHNRFWYKRITGIDAGLPFVVEAAIAETEEPGPHTTAINFSPTFREPLAESRISAGKAEPGFGISGFVSNCFVGRGGASTSFVHIVHPALAFLDRGKSTIAPSSALRDAVGQAIWHTAKTIHAEEERRRKDAAKAQRRSDAADRAWTRTTPEVSVRDAAFRVMEQAWEQATDNGDWPASARTLFYQARPLMQQLTDKPISDVYFTQRLIAEYERDIRKLPGIYFEPRGTLYEPHAGRTVPLGTREVEDYTIPSWTYDKVLYIEKAGLWPVLEQAQLGERYDMAVIAGSGFASVAARTLLAEVAPHCTIFVVHDADPAGYSIALTLAEETRRMPDHQIDVIDIGLTLGEAAALGLETETFARKVALDARLLPHLNEIERVMWKASHRASLRFPAICERVELNAMTTLQLVTHITQALDRHGATAKVVPDAATITAEAASRIRARVSRRLDELLRDLVDVDTIAATIGAEITAEADPLTPEVVRAAIEPARPIDWRTSTGDWAASAVEQADDVITDALQIAIRQAIAA